MVKLAFSGGGMRAIAYIGALRALDEKHVTNIDEVIGSSAGCIYAVACACKVNIWEIKRFMKSIDYSSLVDDSFLIVDIYHLYNNYGWCRGDKLLKLFETILEKFTGNKDITFKELYDKTNIKLIITATNMRDKKTNYFSVDTEPNMMVKIAMRASTAIQFFFEPVMYNNVFYNDGGLLDNYPIKYIMRNNTDQIIGFKLLASNELIIDDEIGIKPQDIRNVKDYAMAIIQMIFNKIDQDDIDATTLNKTVLISTYNISSIDFKLNKQKMKRLIDSGYRSTMKYLERNKNI